MSDNYYYHPVKPAEITSAIAKAYEQMGESGDKFTRNGSVNTFIVETAGYDQARLEEMIVTLTLVHPNRIFLVVVDDAQKDLKAEFAARCHIVAKGEQACSEVIKLTCNHEGLPAAMSVVRANLLTGMPSELYVYDSRSGLETIDDFAALAEQIIYSSRIFSSDLEEAGILLVSSKNLVDIEWIRLGIWRDQIKEIFDNPQWKQSLTGLSAIRITTQSVTSAMPVSVDGLLIVGWLMDRLSLRILGATGKKLILRGVQGSALEESEIELSFSCEKGGSTQDLLGKLEMEFANSDSKLTLFRQNELKAIIQAGEEYCLTKPFDDESDIGLIKRYFFIGESTVNYRNSLSNAMEVSKRIK